MDREAREQVLHKFVRDHRDALFAADLAFVQVMARDDVDVVDPERVGVHALYPAIRLVVPVDRLSGSDTIRNRPAGDPVAECFQELVDHLVRNIVLRLVWTGPIGVAVFVRPVRNVDLDAVRAHIVEHIGDRFGHRIAHSDDRNNRADADNDAEHGEQGAHLIGTQAVDRKRDVFLKVKHARRPLSSPRRSARR